MARGPGRYMHRLQTTHTHEFLGLSNWTSSIWSNSFYGEGIVIGVLDTGILPTHPSFDDTGMPPKPVTWNGTCSPLSGVMCNNKIIGAVAFNRGLAGFGDRHELARHARMWPARQLETSPKMPPFLALPMAQQPGWHQELTWLSTKCASLQAVPTPTY